MISADQRAAQQRRDRVISRAEQIFIAMHTNPNSYAPDAQIALQRAEEFEIAIEKTSCK